MYIYILYIYIFIYIIIYIYVYTYIGQADGPSPKTKAKLVAGGHLGPIDGTFESSGLGLNKDPFYGRNMAQAWLNHFSGGVLDFNRHFLE